MSVLLVGCQSNEPPAPAPALQAAPTLTDVQPDNATPRGLRAAQIIGENFDTHASVEVWFGQTKATRAAIVSKTKIQVEVPPGADNTEVEVRVVEKGHQPAILPLKFKYFEQHAPEE
jgi:hypothetical protein